MAEDETDEVPKLPPDARLGSLDERLDQLQRAEAKRTAKPKPDTSYQAGQLVLSYKLYRCWVSEFQALPDLDASANTVAIQSIKLENEGWERDYDVTEPTEPTFTEPPP